MYAIDIPLKDTVEQELEDVCGQTAFGEHNNTIIRYGGTDGKITNGERVKAKKPGILPNNRWLCWPEGDCHWLMEYEIASIDPRHVGLGENIVSSIKPILSKHNFSLDYNDIPLQHFNYLSQDID